MSDQDVILVDWEVIKVLWGWSYQVQIAWMELVAIAKAAWNMRKNNIKIMLWDRVQLELSVYDTTKGRIIFRYK